MFVCLACRAANLFVNGSLGWDQFHLMISRSTTPDLIKLAGKLEEFFSQQLTSSRRAFSAFGPISSGRRAERRPSQDCESPPHPRPSFDLKL